MNSSYLETLLVGFRIEKLYYMAHLHNIPSILAHGIFCHEQAGKLYRRDIANPAVQERRGLPIPATGGRIHEYVPLYFATHTPMQYVITHAGYGVPSFSRAEIVFLDIQPVRVFQTLGVVFSDGNAAATATGFYTNVKDLGKLSWDLIHHVNICTSPEEKRRKAAEVLVPHHVPIQWIDRVVLHSEEAWETLKDARREYRDQQRSRDPSWEYPRQYKFFIDWYFRYF